MGNLFRFSKLSLPYCTRVDLNQKRQLIFVINLENAPVGIRNFFPGVHGNFGRSHHAFTLLDRESVLDHVKSPFRSHHIATFMA
jgi:hypothetical protein